MSLTVAAILVLMTAGSAQPRTYADIVALYRGGQPDRAVTEAKARSQDVEFNDQADRWRDAAVRAKSSVDLQAALLLHSEVAFGIIDVELNRPTPMTSAALIRVTPRIRRLHDDLAEIERRSPFLRNWYLLWGAFLQSRNATDVDSSANFFLIALREFPEDATVLLTAGSAKEMTWWGAPNNPQRRPDGEHPGGSVGLLREARDYFRKSVDHGLDGPEYEARLRLGRILTALQEYDAAAAEFEKLPSLTGNRDLAYLTHLFVGDLQERRGNLTAAATEYEAALREIPFGQSARLAASHVAHRQGAAKQAAARVADVFSEKSPRSDPWWGYSFGQAWQFIPRLSAARQAVKQ